MKKMTLSLLAAGMLAGAAGLAQAETLVLQNGATLDGHTVATTTAPGGGKTYWIDTPVLVGVGPTVSSTTVLGAGPVMTYDTTVLGAGPVMTYPSPVVTYDTTVLGAGPATVTVPAESSVYLRPSDGISVPIYTVP